MVLLAMVVFSVTNVLDKFILTNYTDPLTYFFVVWIVINISLTISYAYQFKFKNFKLIFAANCPQNVFTSELEFLVFKDFVPKSWAPNKMVGVLAHTMAKDF